MLEVLSLGAGVQSSAVLLMSIRGDLPPLDHVVFADTGWEPASVYRWLEVLKAECLAAGVGFHLVKAHRKGKENIRNDELSGELRAKGSGYMTIPYHTRNADGSSALIRRQCTTIYKVEPVRKKIDLLAGLRPRQRRPKKIIARKWLGISMDEAHRMRDSREAWVEHFYPLIDHDPPLTRAGCLEWLATNGYGRPPRSACVGCPLRNAHDWRWLRDNDEEGWRDALAFDEAIRGKGGEGKSMFIHSSKKPLAEVDLRTEFDRGQLSLFGNDCEGMCGV